MSHNPSDFNLGQAYFFLYNYWHPTLSVPCWTTIYLCLLATYFVGFQIHPPSIHIRSTGRWRAPHSGHSVFSSASDDKHYSNAPYLNRSLDANQLLALLGTAQTMHRFVRRTGRNNRAVRCCRGQNRQQTAIFQQTSPNTFYRINNLLVQT